MHGAGFDKGVHSLVENLTQTAHRNVVLDNESVLRLYNAGRQSIIVVSKKIVIYAIVILIAIMFLPIFLFNISPFCGFRVIGSTYPAGDGCNTCKCGIWGETLCTLKGCIESTTVLAEQQMLNEFVRGEDAILATIPTSHKSYHLNSITEFKIAVKKTVESGDAEYFSVCIGTQTSNSCKIQPSSGVDFAASGDDSGIIFNFITEPVRKITTVNDISILSASMEINEHVEEGIYGFRIYLCPLDDEDDTCRLDDSLGEYSFIFEVIE